MASKARNLFNAVTGRGPRREGRVSEGGRRKASDLYHFTGAGKRFGEYTEPRVISTVTHLGVYDVEENGERNAVLEVPFRHLERPFGILANRSLRIRQNQVSSQYLCSDEFDRPSSEARHKKTVHRGCRHPNPRQLKRPCLEMSENLDDIIFWRIFVFFGCRMGRTRSPPQGVNGLVHLSNKCGHLALGKTARINLGNFGNGDTQRLAP